MKHITLAASLFWSLLSYHEANAQGFWYVPPGADLSFRYGIDLGNGLGFGYGFGVGYGSAGTPDLALGGAVGDLAGLQNQSNTLMLRAFKREEGGSVSGADQKIAEIMHRRHDLKLQNMRAEREARTRYLAYLASHPSLPSRLANEQYDRSTGSILWPGGLLRDSFSVQRPELESLLKSRAQRGNTTDLNAQIVRKTQEIHEELRKQIRTIPTKDYIEANHFLNRLALEGQGPIS